MSGRRTLITAGWVLPVASDPIPEGAVLVEGDRIAAVGPAHELAAHHAADERVDFPGCALMPGLVNAHTHLALSSLAGLTPPAPLHPWLRGVTRAVLGLTHEEFGDAAAAGSLECLRCGTTTVGDIAYGAESKTAALRVGLSGVFFFEVLGLRPDETVESLARRGWRGDIASGRLREGLSPHAPYSSGPALLQQVREMAREHGQPFAIHVAESAAEAQLTLEGTGPFLDQTRRLAHGFTAPMMTPVAYLDRLGVLTDALCIHAVHVSAEDARMLAERTRGVVLCPRSNAYLANGAPPVALLRAADVPLSLGTDSLASNHDLDLFAEARALRELDPGLSATELLRMLTQAGADALSMGDETGALAEGRRADVIAVRIGDVADPEAAVVDLGGADAVDAVLAAGSWRIRDGRPTFDTTAIEVASARLRERTAALIQGE